MFSSKKKEKKSAGCFAHFILYGFIVFIIAVCFSAVNGPQTESEKPGKIEAYVMATQIVEQKLKAPGSAKFCGYTNARVVEYEPGKFTVMGWVDSQNSFGALMRTDFNVVLESTSPNNWNILEFHIQ